MERLPTPPSALSQGLLAPPYQGLLSGQYPEVPPEPRPAPPGRPHAPNAPFGPDRHEAITSASRVALEKGIRLMQGNRLAPTDAAHVSILLRMMDPPPKAIIADLGCGVGEMARLMREERPDLRFVLVNENAYQLSQTPKGPGFIQVPADMHALPLPNACVDGVVLAYTLCHADVPVALREAARITRPGGVLFVYDYERISGGERENAEADRLLASRWYPRADFLRDANHAGWGNAQMANPGGDDSVFRGEFGDNQATYHAIFDHLRPIVWRLTRQGPA